MTSGVPSASTIFLALPGGAANIAFTAFTAAEVLT